MQLNMVINLKKIYISFFDYSAKTHQSKQIFKPHVRLTPRFSWVLELSVKHNNPVQKLTCAHTDIPSTKP